MDIEKLKVLIVVEDVKYRYQLKSNLELIDSILRIDMAANKNELIKFLQKDKYDIVFIDANIIQNQGVETIREIMQNNVNVKFIAVLKSKKDFKVFIGSGLNGCILKDFKICEIETAIKRVSEKYPPYQPHLHLRAGDFYL